VNPPSQPDGFQILRLKGSYEAFGVLIEFLSRIEPFSGYDLGNFANALLRQLREGNHVAAVERDRMVGYCGWLPTTQKIAEAWQKNQGGIGPLKAAETADAVILAVVAAKDRRVLSALIREARKLNPRGRVYFKREYGSDAKPARKRFVQNTTGVE
jgi:hypothetical protein